MRLEITSLDSEIISLQRYFLGSNAHANLVAHHGFHYD